MLQHLGVNSGISRKIFSSYWSRIVFLILYQDSTFLESYDTEVKVFIQHFVFWEKFFFFLAWRFPLQVIFILRTRMLILLSIRKFSERCFILSFNEEIIVILSLQNQVICSILFLEQFSLYQMDREAVKRMVKDPVPLV